MKEINPKTTRKIVSRSNADNIIRTALHIDPSKGHLKMIKKEKKEQ